MVQICGRNNIHHRSRGLPLNKNTSFTSNTLVNKVNHEQNNIVPGKEKAILTLADGSTIVLDSATNGQLATQGITNIINKGGKLEYNIPGGTILLPPPNLQRRWG